jgi:hypothetical protein
VRVLKAADHILYADSKPLLARRLGIQIFLKGSKVVLGILKPGAKNTNITVTRDRMPLPSVMPPMLTEKIRLH